MEEARKYSQIYEVVKNVTNKTVTGGTYPEPSVAILCDNLLLVA